MKKLILILSIFTLFSCSKEENIIKVVYMNIDISKTAKSIKNVNYNDRIEIYLYQLDSIGTIFKYDFKYNQASMFSFDYRKKYYSIKLIDYNFIGTINKNNNILNGSITSSKSSNFIEFKNYKL